MRFIHDIPPPNRLPISAMLAELTVAQLTNLAAHGPACMVAIGAAGAWRPCCRVIDNPVDLMCSGHLAINLAFEQEVAAARHVLDRIIARDRARFARADHKKAAHRPRVRHRENMPYNPQPHPAAEWREPLRQIGEPCGDLDDIGRGHIAMGRLRRRVLDDLRPPSEWTLIPGIARLYRRVPA